jgi:voltage-gated potassium channel Kch
MPVTLIDTNREHQIAGEMEGLEVLPGSGLDDVTLETAGIDKRDVLIAATPNAEVNVLVAQLATEMGVPNVSVMLRDSDSQTFRSLLKASGISIIRAPEDLLDWEHATATGRAQLGRMRVGSERAVESDFSLAPWPDDSGLFPLAVVNAYESNPYTTTTDLAADDEIVYLTISGADAFNVGGHKERIVS